MFTRRRRVLLQPPGYSDTSLYPGLLSNSTHADAQLLLYRPALRGAVRVVARALLVELHDVHALDAREPIGQSFVSRLDYSVTLLTHLTFEAFAAVHYGTRGGDSAWARLRSGRPRLVMQMVPPTAVPPGCSLRPARSFDLGVALRMKIVSGRVAPLRVLADAGGFCGPAAGAAHR